MKQEQQPEQAQAWQLALLARLQLDPAYLSGAQKWFDPLAQALVAHQNSANRTIVVAVNGTQGSGKSTLCAYLEASLASLHHLRTVTLSLDDFYLTRDQRLQLSAAVHPLLATRGVPGTHDMTLLAATLDKLCSGQVEPVDAPRFDKAIDDRRAEPESIAMPVDIILLEGWCLGAMPQRPAELESPVNTLEQEQDTDGRWRHWVNDALAAGFPPIYQRVDTWVMLQAPSFDCVYHWRLEQEQKLAAARQGSGVMDERAVARFIQFYQRLTEECLAHLPDRVHHLFTLDTDRNIQNYQYNASPEGWQ